MNENTVELFVQVLRFLTRCVRQNACLSLLPNVRAVRVLHPVFGCSNGSFRQKEVGPARRLDVQVELFRLFLRLVQVNIILVAEPEDQVVAIVVVSP